MAQAGQPMRGEGALIQLMDAIQQRVNAGAKIKFVTPRELKEIFERARAEVAQAPAGLWEAIPNVPVAAWSAALLPTGKVLLFQNGAQMCLWDPKTRQFKRIFSNTNRFCAGLAMLSEGRLYYPLFLTTDERIPSEGKFLRTGNAGSAAYLLAFHACDTATTNCRDPRNHRVYLAQSDDGVTWSIVPGWRPFRGSVPDVIRRGNTLYIYSAGGGLVRYRLDASTLEPSVNVSVTGLQEGFVDPSLILDDQGRLVLFFLYGRIGSDPAGCPPGQSSCVNRFGSATEVPGSDGTQFVLDEGDRASVMLSASSGPRSASDPDVFFDGTQYILYISHGPSISVWTSSELRGAYRKIADLALGTGGVPSGHFDAASKRYWTYAHVPRGNVAVIRRAVHPDFSKLLGETDWTTVITGASLGLTPATTVESPGFAVNVALDTVELLKAQPTDAASAQDVGGWIFSPQASGWARITRRILSDFFLR